MTHPDILKERNVFPIPPAVPGYQPRGLSPEEHELEKACSRGAPDSAMFWTAQVARARRPHAAASTIDSVIEGARDVVADAMGRGYSPFAVVDVLHEHLGAEAAVAKAA